jgi:hypothetical protein
MKPGTRLASAVTPTEVIVVRGAEVVLECGGSPMVEGVTDRATADVPGQTLLGRRYTDETSALVVLCTRPGPGTLSVEERDLVELSAKQLPASD